MDESLVKKFCNNGAALNDEQMLMLMQWCTDHQTPLKQHDPFTFRRHLDAIIGRHMPEMDKTAQSLLATFLLALAIVLRYLTGHVDSRTYYDALTEVVTLRHHFTVHGQQLLATKPTFLALWVRPEDSALESWIADLPAELGAMVHFVSLDSPVGRTVCTNVHSDIREQDILMGAKGVCC